MIYQLKITLAHAKPPIWRRIELSDDTPLEDLHKIIQTAMGWTNSHLHHFMANNEFYTPPTEWNDMGEDYTEMTVKDLLQKEGQKIQYEYDFGDSWVHWIQLEKIKEPNATTQYPICTKGKKAGPPEDCGGIWGYMNLIEIMKDKKHESYEETLEWLGGELDPDDFDIDMVNERLQSEDYGTASFFGF